MSENHILSYLKYEKEKKGIEILYKEVFPILCSFLLKRGASKEQIEDVFHDSVLKLILKVRKDEVKEETDVKAYLFVIAKNTWSTMAKREQKIQFTDDLTVMDRKIDVLNNDEDEKRVQMEEILNSLGDTCRELLKLTYYLNFSLKEAAEKMKLSSTEIAKTYHYRCKKKLFTKVKDNKVFRSLMNV